jgi:hypothetical protein
LPLRGVIPAVFLAIALVFSAFYLAYPSGWSSIDPSGESTKEDWFRTFGRWMEELVIRRTNYLRASLVALAFGALFLPAAFVHVKTTPAAPPTKAEWPAPPSDNVRLQKVLYKAQVEEVAKLREKAAPGSKGEFSIKERWIWIAAGVGLGIIILILIFGKTRRSGGGRIPVPGQLRGPA